MASMNQNEGAEAPVRIDGETVQKGGMYARFEAGKILLPGFGPMTPAMARDLAEVLRWAARAAQPEGDAAHWEALYISERLAREDAEFDAVIMATMFEHYSTRVDKSDRMFADMLKRAEKALAKHGPARFEKADRT